MVKTRRELFFNRLASFLEEENFELKKNSFVKKQEQGEVIIEFSIWPDFGQVEPNYTILINDIENVKKQVFKGKYSKCFSLGNSRYQLSGIAEDSTLDTSTDHLALIAAEKEIVFYQKVLKDYFLKNTSVVYLDYILNSKPGENLYIAYNPIDTCFLAVIVAGISKNKNTLDLVDFYRPIVQRNNRNRINSFNRLAEYVLSSY